MKLILEGDECLAYFVWKNKQVLKEIAEQMAEKTFNKNIHKLEKQYNKLRKLELR